MKRRINIFKATKAALAVAKARSVNQAQADSRAADLRPVIEAIRASGCTSLRQIAARLNDRGIVTPRGKEWKAAQVRLLLQRLDQPTSTAESLKNRDIGLRKGHATRKAQADSRATGLAPVIEDIRASGATSLHQIAKELSARGIVTLRGKEWQAAHVWKLLARLDNLAPAS